MTVYFCDSSALVKCYVQEQGSAWLLALLDPTAGHHLYVASITGVEVIAAVTRRVRRGDIAATDGAAALAQFRQDFAQRSRLIDLTPPLVAQAMTLAETHSLRGYDAVPLATCPEKTQRKECISLTKTGVKSGYLGQRSHGSGTQLVRSIVE